MNPFYSISFKLKDLENLKQNGVTFLSPMNHKSEKEKNLSTGKHIEELPIDQSFNWDSKNVLRILKKQYEENRYFCTREDNDIFPRSISENLDSIPFHKPTPLYLHGYCSPSKREILSDEETSEENISSFLSPVKRTNIKERPFSSSSSIFDNKGESFLTPLKDLSHTKSCDAEKEKKGEEYSIELNLTPVKKV